MKKLDSSMRIQANSWHPNVIADFERKQNIGCVGTQLVSKSERVRIWSIRLKPYERIGCHRHVLDYLWTATAQVATSTTISNDTRKPSLVCLTIRPQYSGTLQWHKFRVGQGWSQNPEDAGRSRSHMQQS